MHDQFDIRLGGTGSSLSGVVQVKLEDDSTRRVLCYQPESVVSLNTRRMNKLNLDKNS